jgi:hypothetical protein
MSWIRSDKAILHHPKTTHLKVLLRVEMDVVIGRLHRLWWWCLDYALDGDLSKHPPKVIQDACGIPLRDLMRAGFVDSRPRTRIHDWWDNQGNYLKLRFRDHPDKWMQIRDSYMSKSHMSEHMSTPMGKPVDVDLITKRTDVANGRTDVDLNARASLVAPRATEGLTKVEGDDMPEFDHEDFLKVGWLSSEMPQDHFQWEHLERSLPEQERVMSKMREKFYAQKKHWN